MANVTKLKKGDKAVRNLAGVEMVMTVVKVNKDTLIAAAPGTIAWPEDELWTFDRYTGAEEDEDLNWGVRFGRTGSVLRPLE